MGRSTSYLTNSLHEVYFPSTQFEDEFDWEDFKLGLEETLKSKLPSLESCDYWGGREDHIFLNNSLCEIALSDYCGLACLSIRINESSADYFDQDIEPLAGNWIDKIKHHLDGAIEQIIGYRLEKSGSFSNGEGIYNLVTKPENIQIATVCHNSGGYTYTQ